MMMSTIKAQEKDPRFQTSHDVYMFTNMYLQELGEIFWFRGENEITKGNKSRAEFYTKKYHELHDVKREIDKLDWKTQHNHTFMDDSGICAKCGVKVK